MGKFSDWKYSKYMAASPLEIARMSSVVIPLIVTSSYSACPTIQALLTGPKRLSVRDNIQLDELRTRTTLVLIVCETAKSQALHKVP